MAYFNVEADVLAFRSDTVGDISRATQKNTLLPTLPEPQVASENLANLHAFFATAGVAADYEERPRKKLKIDTDIQYDLKSAQGQKDGSVVLAKVSLDLVGVYIISQCIPLMNTLEICP